jgi:N utilization substance protein B
VGRRTKARECAFQILYQWQISGEPIAGVLESFWRVRSGTPEARAMAERLARGASARSEALDQQIAEAATHWRIERIAPVDRTILRLGAYELAEEKATPAAVVLDEAVELAKRFGEEDSPAFVNGVLDAIRKRVRGEPAGAAERAEQQR